MNNGIERMFSPKREWQGVNIKERFSSLSHPLQGSVVSIQRFSSHQQDILYVTDGVIHDSEARSETIFYRGMFPLECADNPNFLGMAVSAWGEADRKVIKLQELQEEVYALYSRDFMDTPVVIGYVPTVLDGSFYLSDQLPSRFYSLNVHERAAIIAGAVDEAIYKFCQDDPDTAFKTLKGKYAYYVERSDSELEEQMRELAEKRRRMHAPLEKLSGNGNGNGQQDGQELVFASVIAAPVQRGSNGH